MTKNMRMIAFFFIILFVQSCEKVDRDYPLYMLNNSDHSISVLLNNDEDFKALYPDTSISAIQRGIVEIPAHEKKSISGGSASWKSVFDVSVPFDTLSLFVFHSDTVAKYDWNTIRNGYKILQRYDLSLEDRERLSFTLAYPPDANNMSGIKMFAK